MITDTPKGKEVRKYFIQVEKEYHKQLTVGKLTPEQLMEQSYIAQTKRRIEAERVRKLIRLMIKTVNNDKMLNEMLGNPFYGK